MQLPLHQLTNTQTKVWLLGGMPRRELASVIARRYPDGCGVIAWRGQHIAWIAPNGEVRELSPPFRRYHRRQVANPADPKGCACRNFFDPEVGGPWSERGLDRHHPLCEFTATSHETYAELTRGIPLPTNGVSIGINQRARRPDAALLIEQELLGKRGSKTGPRMR